MMYARIDGWLSGPRERADQQRWTIGGNLWWLLDDVRPLPRVVECTGKVGLWRLPDDIEQTVRALTGLQ